VAEWPPELRLAAAWAGLDWMIAGLARTVEHLHQSERPGLAPMMEETSERLAGLQRLLAAVWQGEQDLEP
jgi:hypothetical protein